MLTCYHCAKLIKSKGVHIVPSTLHQRLGIDFPRVYHPTCYRQAEIEAAKELYPDQPEMWFAKVPV